MNAAAITAKIKKIANKYGPFDERTAYKRGVNQSSGNTLIDRGVTTTVADTAFSPQPIFKRVGNRAEILSGTEMVLPDDYEFVFTPDQMTESDVASKSNILVLKDLSGNEEVLQVVLHRPIVLNGTEIGTTAIYRSVSR